MILATTTVEDFDRFLNIFSTKGADKRREHGEVPPIMKEAGHKGPPQMAAPGGNYGS
jgi:hypothetical protein